MDPMASTGHQRGINGHQMRQGMAGSEVEPDRGWEHVIKEPTGAFFET